MKTNKSDVGRMLTERCIALKELYESGKMSLSEANDALENIRSAILSAIRFDDLEPRSYDTIVKTKPKFYPDPKDENLHHRISPEGDIGKSGYFIDPRDKNLYRYKRIEDTLWLDQNLEYIPLEDDKMGESKKNNTWINKGYDFTLATKGKIDVTKLGMFYSKKVALIACPPGWRLPIYQDWSKLISYFGGERLAYKALMQGGSSRLNFQLGGYISNFQQYKFGEIGGYWGREKEGLKKLIAFEFSDNDKKITIRDEKHYDGLSCRCVRDS